MIRKILTYDANISNTIEPIVTTSPNVLFDIPIPMIDHMMISSILAIRDQVNAPLIALLTSACREDSSGP